MIKLTERKKERIDDKAENYCINALLNVRWKFHFGNICVVQTDTQKRNNLLQQQQQTMKNKLIKICVVAALLSYD